VKIAIEGIQEYRKDKITTGTC